MNKGVKNGIFTSALTAMYKDKITKINDIREKLAVDIHKYTYGKDFKLLETLDPSWVAETSYMHISGHSFVTFNSDYLYELRQKPKYVYRTSWTKVTDNVRLKNRLKVKHADSNGFSITKLNKSLSTRFDKLKKSSEELKLEIEATAKELNTVLNCTKSVKKLLVLLPQLKDHCPEEIINLPALIPNVGRIEAAFKEVKKK